MAMSRYQRYKNADEIEVRFTITRELSEKIERFRKSYELKDGTRVLRTKAVARMLAAVEETESRKA